MKRALSQLASRLYRSSQTGHDLAILLAMAMFCTGCQQREDRTAEVQKLKADIAELTTAVKALSAATNMTSKVPVVSSASPTVATQPSPVKVRAGTVTFKGGKKRSFSNLWGVVEREGSAPVTGFSSGTVVSGNVVTKRDEKLPDRMEFESNHTSIVLPLDQVQQMSFGAFRSYDGSRRLEVLSKTGTKQVFDAMRLRLGVLWADGITEETHSPCADYSYATKDVQTFPDWEGSTIAFER
jgi:hypothetical protein